MRLDAAVTPPLELRGPFRQPGATPRYFLRNVTAGVFGGDDYRIRVRAEADTRVHLQPTAATRVYESVGAPSRIRTRLHAAAGADLTYDAGTTILQAGADLEQSTELVAHASATLRYIEVVALGRLASGERLAFRRFASSLSARSLDGRVLYEERFELAPPSRDAAMGAPHDLDAALGEASVVGTLVVIGPGQALDAARMALESEGHTSVLAGTSTLPRGEGYIVRALGGRVEPVRHLLDAMLAR